ncbi:ABC transporter ATP-binding protein [Nocardioides hwasunensis]|uniref:ABC transporter ATP-binding protein n=1 Tax=Nocardioides hwasunensis TaxID=397258 RepID=A0ABR8MJY7_9ACTN|nr:ABC transporter ATP-binding protein [Nocardioides hwasunensis]MBD3916346.1 ABC transporter ATP-binding protein [Nocardioides hwasunensis]
MSAPVLAVDDLRVVFDTDRGPALTIDGVSFEVRAGETVGIVGESGSGKSTTSLAVMGLLPRNAQVTGSIRLQGRELLGLADDEMRELRGNRVAMVFQDSLAALNPVVSVGDQLAEAVRVHRPGTRPSVLRARAIELLELVGIPSPQTRVDRYPHEFSGGMRQRAVIAMAVANEPSLIIADEPTTALDVTVQAQILQVLRDVQTATGTAIMLITHDLGVVAGVADRVLVMYAGGLVEQGSVEQAFYEPSHPYTRGLLASLPRTDRRSRDERLFQIAGQPPRPTALPPGCRFGPRCGFFQADPCATTAPPAVPVGTGHVAACHFVDRVIATPVDATSSDARDRGTDD